MCSSYYQDSSPGLKMAIHPQLQKGHKVDLVFLVQQLLFGTRLGSPGCLVVSNAMLHGECFPLLLEDGLLLHSAFSLEPLVCVIATDTFSDYSGVVPGRSVIPTLALETN